jgi:hypothetical protein
VIKRLAVLLVFAVTIDDVYARRRLEIHAAPVPQTQAIDATRLRRHTKSEIEVFVVQQARGAGLLTFQLNGKAVVKLGYADWVCLYLPPGRYRFGAAPSGFGRGVSPETIADVSTKNVQLYRISQTAGFTSSGGNAVYEISLEQ